MKISNRAWNAFLSELAAHPPRNYKSSSSIIQSSVAIIYRQFNVNQLQVLLTQRAGYHSDPNAYNVVFPGGQCDNDQTDRQACQRQVFQQVGLNVNEQCAYKGQIPTNFYYMSKRGKSLYITCHVYLLQNHQYVPKLNPDQLRAYKWVSVEELLNRDNYIMGNQLKLGIMERMTGKYKWLQSVKGKVKRVSMPEVVIGMDRNLWGLTLWVWSYCLQMAEHNLGREKREGKDEGIGARIGTETEIETKTETQTRALSELTAHIRRFQIQFTPWFILKYPCLAGIYTWHNLYRVKPFTYTTNQPISKIKIIIALLLIIVIMYILL